MAVKIANRRELEAWLKKQPRKVSVAFAARAALRVLPIIQTAEKAKDFRRTIVLPVFRATAISWAGSKFPAQEMEFCSADAFATARAAFAPDVAARFAFWSAVSAGAAPHRDESNGVRSRRLAALASFFAPAALWNSRAALVPVTRDESRAPRRQ